MLKHCIFLFFLLQLNFLAAQSWQNVIQSTYSKVSKSVVGLEVYVEKKKRGSKKQFLLRGRYYGTGFVIAKGLILTTREVVQNKTKVACFYYDGAKEALDVLAYDEKSPLVLLKMKRDLPPLKLQTSFETGHIVITLGNPYKSIPRVLQIACSLGVITGIYNYSREAFSFPVLETDAGINPGNYGGPLVNMKGEVVGVVFSGYNWVRGMGLAVPATTISQLLQQYQQGKLKAPDDIGILQFSSVYIGVKVRQTALGVKIAEVEPESPALRSKLAVGDFIKKVGSIKITSSLHYKQTLQRYFPGQKITVVISRGGLLKEIKITLHTKFM